MKFVQLKVDGKKVLVNLALVTDIHIRSNRGCRIYFSNPNSYLDVDESLDGMEIKCIGSHYY